MGRCIVCGDESGRFLQCEACREGPRTRETATGAAKSPEPAPTPPAIAQHTERPKGLALRLPLPPSVNNYWTVPKLKPGGPKRTRVKTRLAREFSKLCVGWAQKQGARVLEGDVEVRVRFFFNRRGCDVDNRIKPLLDCLKGVCFEDDRQVAMICAERRLDPGAPRAEVWIAPVTPRESN